MHFNGAVEITISEIRRDGSVVAVYALKDGGSRLEPLPLGYDVRLDPSLRLRPSALAERMIA
jgi:hypothetical protein